MQQKNSEFRNMHTQIQKVILYSKAGFKDFWHRNTNQTQIWYGEFKQ